MFLKVYKYIDEIFKKENKLSNFVGQVATSKTSRNRYI